MRREALKSLQLTHPNILRVYDFHEPEDGPPFLAMEHVDGTAANTLKSEHADSVLPWEQVAPIARQICDALIYAHAERVVHRDLKPANILIDLEGVTKLGDFGISASMMDTISQATQDITGTGTPAYMSPEQMGGAPPNAQDDIYALGATLYDLLTGKPPFYTGDIGFQAWHKPATPIPDRLEEFGIINEVPDYVAETVMKCLAKEIKDRPQSVAEISTALRLEGITVTTPVRHLTGKGTSKTPAADNGLSENPRARHWRTQLILASAFILLCTVLFLSDDAEPQPQQIASDTVPSSVRPKTIPPGQLVNLLDPVHLEQASIIQVLRDNSVSTASGAGRMRRLKSLDSKLWPDRGSEWRLTNGVLEVAIEAIEEPMSREYTIWFPTAHATNFEVGYSFIWPDSDFPEKQATTFFGRSSTNHASDRCSRN